MNRQSKFIRDEIASLKDTIQASEFTLGWWKKNAENATWPAEIVPSVEVLQQNMKTMSGSLVHIEEILANIDNWNS